MVSSYATKGIVVDGTICRTLAWALPIVVGDKFSIERRKSRI